MPDSFRQLESVSTKGFPLGERKCRIPSSFPLIRFAALSTFPRLGEGFHGRATGESWMWESCATVFVSWGVQPPKGFPLRGGSAVGGGEV